MGKSAWINTSTKLIIIRLRQLPVSMQEHQQSDGKLKISSEASTNKSAGTTVLEYQGSPFFLVPGKRSRFCPAPAGIAYRTVKNPDTASPETTQELNALQPITVL
jgi:hypothetical protein